MTYTTALELLFILMGVAFCFIGKLVFENRKRINSNLTYIQKNKELIEKNANLIHLLNVMLSNSELKVEWKKYATDLKKFGIIIDDPHRNLDIDDPEG